MLGGWISKSPLRKSGSLLSDLRAWLIDRSQTGMSLGYRILKHFFVAGSWRADAAPLVINSESYIVRYQSATCDSTGRLVFSGADSPIVLSSTPNLQVRLNFCACRLEYTNAACMDGWAPSDFLCIESDRRQSIGLKRGVASNINPRISHGSYGCSIICALVRKWS